MYRLLPALAFFSGVSGIAYELLYMRILSTYLGSVFYVVAAILTVFFMGIALGSYLSPRYISKLKYIELGIGLYAILIAFIVYKSGLSLTFFVSTLPFGEIFNLVFFVFITLGIPAALIGFTTPIFSQYLQSYKAAESGFSTTYILYNFGAALSVIVVEYVLIRAFGITSSVLIFAFINIGIAGLLWSIDVPKISHVRQPLTKLAYRDGKVLLAVSIISGVVQLAILSLFEHIIGPLNENFALVLFVMLISISIGTLAERHFKLSLNKVILLASFVVLIPLLALGLLLGVYGFFYDFSNFSYLGIQLSRLFVVVAVLSPMSIIFGATVPAVVEKHGIHTSGTFLSIAALGNALGFLMFLFLLFEIVSLPILFGMVSLTLFVIYLWKLGTLNFKMVSLIIPLSLLMIIMVNAWPQYIGVVAYNRITDVEYINSILGSDIEVIRYKKYNDDVTIVKNNSHHNYTLMFNGYQSLTFSTAGRSHLNELQVGAIGSRFTNTHDSALVFGLGTGVTAAAVADYYDSVVVAEINPVMLNAAEYFKQWNDNVLSRENVSIEIQDGLITLLSDNKKYDLVVNTVTTPSYFSSNKLWTKEVFEEISSRLNSGGVFVGWMDSRIGMDGVDVMLATLDDTFNDCAYMFLNTGYYAFICGNEELSYNAASYPASLLAKELQKRTDTFDVDTVMRNMLFHISEKPTDTTVRNTLNRPVLEYTYVFDGTLAGEQIQSRFKDDFYVDAFTGESKDELLVKSLLDMLHPPSN